MEPPEIPSQEAVAQAIADGQEILAQDDSGLMTATEGETKMRGILKILVPIAIIHHIRNK